MPSAPLHAGSPLTGPLAEMATVYHSDDWLELLSGYFGYRPAPRVLTNSSRPVALAALVETGGFRGKTLRAPPASMYGHLLADSEYFLAKLVESLAEQARECHRRLLVNVAADNAYGLSVVNREIDSRIPAHPPDDVWKLVHQSVRRSIRKSRKHNVTVRVGGTADVNNFFALLVATRRRIGLPVAPLGWLHKILQADFAGLLIAQHDNIPVAGILYLEDGHHIHYALPAYSDQGAKLRATDACLWELIKHGHASGKQWICLGGSPIENEGLRRFKRKWGGQERTMTLLSDRPPGQARLERPVLMPRLIPYLPSWVLQILGYCYLRYCQ